MIIVMKPGTPKEEIERITQQISHANLTTEPIFGKHKIVIGLVGETSPLDPRQLETISPFIEQVLRVKQPFKKVSREFRHGEASEIIIETPNEPVIIGEHHPIVHVAGPCSVENEQMIVETAHKLKALGVQFLRGGAYKPRTSPYAFQGHGESALDLLALARSETGLGIVTEVMDTADVDKVAKVADIIQIGARNMQNFPLLKKVGSQDKAVLLKRGLSATVDEWLMAAEYILASGNRNVILCERGIRAFDQKYTRNVLDLAIIPVLRQLTHLPIMIDPSHATGNSAYVSSMAKAAIVAGTDSLMIEVHPEPSKALSDGLQSLTPDAYSELMQEMKMVSHGIGRSSYKLHQSNFFSGMYKDAFVALKS